MILVIVRIIITGFEDFGSGSGFCFLFRFTVLKKLNKFLMPNNFFLIKKIWKTDQIGEKSENEA